MANDLPTIDTAMLEAVTGGKSDPNAAVTALLTQLMSSIKDLAQNQGNSGGNNQFMQMLPIIMMMSRRPGPPPPPPVVAGPPPGDGWVRVA